jgi:hypothetical protein
MLSPRKTYIQRNQLTMVDGKLLRPYTSIRQRPHITIPFHCSEAEPYWDVPWVAFRELIDNLAHTGRYDIDRHAIIVHNIPGKGRESTHAVALAFLPRTFFGGAGFGSFRVAMRAETRARAA